MVEERGIGQVGGGRGEVAALEADAHPVAGAGELQELVRHWRDPANVRLAAWQRTLQDAGVQAPPPWQGDWTARSGYQIGQQLSLIHI